MNDSFLSKDEIKTYLKDIKNEKSKPISRDEEKNIIRRIKNGDVSAKERLICSNLRFVISVAKDYQNQGLDLSDLINEGNHGLIVAAERFDPDNYNVKFISFAVWWIQQRIMSALCNYGRLVRIPSNKINESQRLKKSNDNYTEEDVAQELDIPLFNASLNDEVQEGTELADLMESNEFTAEKQYEDEADLEIKRQLNSAIENLNYREKTIIKAYFGIGEEPKKLEQISEEYYPDLSKERIRQHRMQAVRKLRDKAIYLTKYLND